MDEDSNNLISNNSICLVKKHHKYIYMCVCVHALSTLEVFVDFFRLIIYMGGINACMFIYTFLHHFSSRKLVE